MNGSSATRLLWPARTLICMMATKSRLPEREQVIVHHPDGAENFERAQNGSGDLGDRFDQPLKIAVGGQSISGDVALHDRHQAALPRQTPIASDRVLHIEVAENLLGFRPARDRKPCYRQIKRRGDEIRKRQYAARPQHAKRFLEEDFAAGKMKDAFHRQQAVETSIVERKRASVALAERHVVFV